MLAPSGRPVVLMALPKAFGDCGLERLDLRIAVSIAQRMPGAGRPARRARASGRGNLARLHPRQFTDAVTALSLS